MKPCLRTGVDVVYIPRFKKFLENSEAVKKAFHSSELKRDSAEHLAGVFAVKEAFFKALGENPHFLDIEVNADGGKPSVTHGSGYPIESIDVSVSHDQDYCFASVVMLLRGKSQ